MIVQTHLENGLVCTYSNAGFKIHGGSPEGDYDVVYDPEDANRTYVETNIPVDAPVSGPTQYSKLKILLAAKQQGLENDLFSFLESDKMAEYTWNASNVIEDNALLAEYIPIVAQYFDKTDAEIRAFLDNYCKI